MFFSLNITFLFQALENIPDLLLHQSFQMVEISLNLVFQFLIYCCGFMSFFRYKVYLTTLLTVASLAGMLAAFSIIKDRLNKELHLEERFLGILDSLMFVGRFLGSIIVLVFPSKQPKKAYFIACTCATFFQLLLPFSIYFGQYGKYLMLIGMFGSGICRAYIMTPFLFLSEVYNKDSDKPMLSIWNALTHIGQVVGTFFAYFTVYSLDLKWEISYEICVVFYFIFALIFFLAVKQKSFGNQAETQEKQFSVKEKFSKCYNVVKGFYSQPRCYLWCLDYCLQAVFITNVVFWFPYYFVQNGFGVSSTFIAVAFYVAHVVGTLGFQAAIRNFEQKSNFICAIMLLSMFFILLGGTIFLGTDKSQSVYYIGMLTLIGLLSGGASNRIGYADYLQLVGSDKQVKYYSLFFSKMTQCLVSVLAMVLIGHMMQLNQRSIFYITIGNILASLVVYITRKFLLGYIQNWFGNDSQQYVSVDEQICDRQYDLK